MLLHHSFWFTMEDMGGIEDFDDEKVIGIKLEYVSHQDGSYDKSNVKQPGDQSQNTIDVVQIKQEVHSNSDIEVDVAYGTIDTFNPCEVKTFNQEDEKISPDTKTPLKIGQTNNEHTQLKVEVDTNTDIDSEMTNSLNVCDKQQNASIRDHVDYDTLTREDQVHKRPVYQLHTRGMY